MRGGVYYVVWCENVMIAQLPVCALIHSFRSHGAQNICHRREALHTRVKSLSLAITMQ